MGTSPWTAGISAQQEKFVNLPTAHTVNSEAWLLIPLTNRWMHHDLYKLHWVRRCVKKLHLHIHTSTRTKNEHSELRRGRPSHMTVQASALTNVALKIQR